MTSATARGSSGSASRDRLASAKCLTPSPQRSTEQLPPWRASRPLREERPQQTASRFHKDSRVSARCNYGNAWYNPRIDRAFGRQPLAFEPSVGQADAEVEFVTRGPGYQLFLTATEAVMVLISPNPSEGAKRLGVRQPSAAFSWYETASATPENWRTPNAATDALGPVEPSPAPRDSRVLRMRLVGANNSPRSRAKSKSVVFSWTRQEFR